MIERFLKSDHIIDRNLIFTNTNLKMKLNIFVSFVSLIFIFNIKDTSNDKFSDCINQLLYFLMKARNSSNEILPEPSLSIWLKFH